MRSLSFIARARFFFKVCHSPMNNLLDLHPPLTDGKKQSGEVLHGAGLGWLYLLFGLPSGRLPVTFVARMCLAMKIVSEQSIIWWVNVYWLIKVYGCCVEVGKALADRRAVWARTAAWAARGEVLCGWRGLSSRSLSALHHLQWQKVRSAAKDHQVNR